MDIDKVKKKVASARSLLILRHPFYGMLLLGLEEEWDEGGVDTIGVRPGVVEYNSEWLNGLTLEETIGVMAHEASHLGLLHPFRRKDRDHEVFNHACDHAINLMLESETKLTLPQPRLDDKRFANMNAEGIYAVLMRELDKSKEGASSAGGGAPSSIPAPAASGGKPPKGKGSNKGSSEVEGDEDSGKNKDKGGKPTAGKARENFDDHPWPDDLPNGKMAKLEREAVDNLIRAATIAKSAGKLPGAWESIINDVLEPRIDWKDRLRSFVQTSAKSNYRMIPPNKRHLWRGLYLPSLGGDYLELIIGVDTSGSVSEQELKEFTSEIKGICKSFEDYKIWYFQADAAIQKEKELGPEDEIPTKMRGRGGTSFRPVFERAREIYGASCLVYLSDLCPNDSWPDPLDIPVLWVSSTDVVAPFGETIRLELDKGRR